MTKHSTEARSFIENRCRPVLEDELEFAGAAVPLAGSRNRLQFNRKLTILAQQVLDRCPLRMITVDDNLAAAVEFQCEWLRRIDARKL